MSNVLHQIKTSESEQTRLLELAQLNRLNPHAIANVALDHFLASLASVTAAKPYFYASPCSATLKPYWISKGNNSKVESLAKRYDMAPHRIIYTALILMFDPTEQGAF